MFRSQELFSHAQRVIAGGVNSPVRAFKGVGGTPLFFRRGRAPTSLTRTSGVISTTSVCGAR